MNRGLLWLAGGALAAASCGQEKAGLQPPNIVFILADDLGWGDLSCYGQEKFSTPNIDALAQDGLRFTQCYSGTTVSAPSRSCLVTGTHSGHTAVRGNVELPPEGQFPLPEGSQTFFNDLKSIGYTTGAFGKWGLGFVDSTGDPFKQGVDYFFGFNCQLLAHSYYPDHLWDNDRRVELKDNRDDIPYGEGTYAPDLIHEKAIQFLEERTEDGKPFFLWYPTTIPHAELIVPEDSIILKFRGTYPEKPYKGIDDGPYFRKGGYVSQEYPHATFAAMVTRLDNYVGDIVTKLKALGLYENTVILFASDNGPHKEGGHDPDFFNSNGPWKGYKRDVYEGGIRVPMIVSWPGHIAKGETDFMCSFWDMMPTLRDLTGSASPDGMDGVSLLPLLKGKGKQKEHDFLYFEFQELGGRQAVRKGPWKLVHMDIRGDSPRFELYNLENDPGETEDLAAKMPEKVNELKVIMDESHIPNPDFPLLPGERRESGE
ncbi:MAG: arylsulfatase [Bacteroidales bacterium]|nr:arylsulfatase [Bacteroidales bacterium]